MFSPTLSIDFSFHSILAFTPSEPLLSRSAPALAPARQTLGRQLPCSHTLADSSHSFLQSCPLFSIPCGLFVQNTRGGVLCVCLRVLRASLSRAPKGALLLALRFATPLFSYVYKLLFLQAFYFHNYLRCPMFFPSSPALALCALVRSVLNPHPRFSFSELACYRARQQGGFFKCPLIK
jgi:hypothetical protein